MSQLDQFEAEFRFDFAQHFISGNVSPRIPASGERNHRCEMWGVRRGERHLR
jgi:hypothetical protein